MRRRENGVVGMRGWWCVVLTCLLLSGFASASNTRKQAGNPAPAQSRNLPTDEAVLAVVNGEKITAGMLRERMKSSDARHNRSFLGEDRARHVLFRNLVQDLLIIQHMKKKGAMESAEHKGRVQAKETIGLGNLYYERLERESVPSDNEVRKFLPAYFKTVDFRIFFGSTYQDAYEARRETLEGGNLEAIVRARSVGPGAGEGGLVQGFGFGSSMLPEHIKEPLFEESPGWLSPIFENDLGFNFLRLEKTVDFSPEQMEKLSRSALDQAKREAARRTLSELPLPGSIKKDAALVRTLDALPLPAWKEHYPKVLAREGKRPITVQELYWFLSMGRSPGKQATEQVHTSESLDLYIRYRAAAKAARKENLHKSPVVTDALRETSREILKEMFQQEMERGVRIEEAEARAYFGKHRERWRRPEGREVLVIAWKKDLPLPEEVRDLKEMPEKFEMLVRKLPQDASLGPDPQKVYRGAMPKSLEEAVFRAPEGEVVGPVEERGRLYFFRVDRKVPPVDSPRYEEHAEEARRSLKQERIDLVVREKKEELWKQAGVITYTAVLDRIEWPSTGEPGPANFHRGGH